LRWLGAQWEWRLAAPVASLGPWVLGWLKVVLADAHGRLRGARPEGDLGFGVGGHEPGARWKGSLAATATDSRAWAEPPLDSDSVWVAAVLSYPPVPGSPVTRASG